MNTVIVKQTKPDSGRDNKTCRAYSDCASWIMNPLHVSANSTNSAEVAAIRCAAKAFVKVHGGDPDEVETRIKLIQLPARDAGVWINGVWRAELQPKRFSTTTTTKKPL